MTKSKQLREHAHKLHVEFLKFDAQYRDSLDSINISQAAKDGFRRDRAHAKEAWDTARCAAEDAAHAEQSKTVVALQSASEDWNIGAIGNRYATICSDSYTAEIAPNGSGEANPEKAAALAHILATATINYAVLRGIKEQLDNLDWLPMGHENRRGYLTLWEQWGEKLILALERSEGRAV